MDENVLRDAVLVRLENIRFEAYVHVNGLMWKVTFAELRALTNGVRCWVQTLAETT